MPYGDLLRALEAEVRAQRLAIEAEAHAEAGRIAAEGRRLSVAAREEALARAAVAAEATREEARRRAAARVERAELVARDRALALARAEVAERLAALSSPATTGALLAEVMEDDDGSDLVVTCDPGHGAACREWLARHRPGAATRARIVEAAAPRGGVALAVGDGLVVENTFPSRLDRAWPGLAPELGRLLFGDRDG